MDDKSLYTLYILSHTMAWPLSSSVEIMDEKSLYTLHILISLIDLRESAGADEIWANIGNRGYSRAPLARHLFADALQALLLDGHVSLSQSRSTSGADVYEVDYPAYILLQELFNNVSSAELSPHGLARLKEVETYIDEIVSDGAGDEQELLAQSLERGMSLSEAQYLVEKVRAQRLGYPYDILLQAREAKRGRGKIYVVLLDERVKNRRKVKAGHNPDLPAVYVGLTTLSIEQRLLNHKNNYKAGKGYVRDYGIRPLPELYEAYNPMPAKLARKAEAALAEKLRLQGYTVLGGH